MEDKLVFEYVESDGEEGALLLGEEGLYFQRYLNGEEYFAYLGESVSINSTGAFGAINLISKLSEKSNATPREIAHRIRSQLSVGELLENGLLEHYSWKEIVNNKNRKIMGVLEVVTSTGRVFKLKVPEERENAYKAIKKCIDGIKA